jgi:hypothetical protein
MPQRFLGDASPTAMKILNYILPTVSLWLTAVGLDVNAAYIALALAASGAGSLFLSYYRPEKTFGRMVSKMLLSTLAGLIFGTAIVQWRQVETYSFAAVVYCLVSLLALMFLKSVVGVGEQNADSITKTVLQRIFQIPLRGALDSDTAKTNLSTRKGVSITKVDDEQPVVTIHKSAKPDLVQVIESTEVTKKTQEGG